MNAKKSKLIRKAIGYTKSEQNDYDYVQHYNGRITKVNKENSSRAHYKHIKGMYKFVSTTGNKQLKGTLSKVLSGGEKT